MSLRIAFDMDGVVADMHRAIARYVAASPARNRSPLDVVTTDPVTDLAPNTPRERLALERRICTIENFWETLDELEAGAVAQLAALASTRRWEVVFLTDRPPTVGLPVQVQTQQWLNRHGFSLPSVLTASNVNRGKLASVLKLDVVVDDRPENCVDVATESTARAVLLSSSLEPSGMAFARRLDIQVVRSMTECLDVLQAWDASGTSMSRIVGHVRQLFGLGATPPPPPKDTV